jgi:hypothetical protein
MKFLLLYSLRDNAECQSTGFDSYSIDVANNQTPSILIVAYVIILISYCKYPIRKNEHKVQVLSFLKKQKKKHR